ncbi:MAG: DNA polymerase III subunit delta' [Deltaproteobacteria bacterium]|nr:DNA polymerase III subunit delta' [Deltaproteobacteria bacterium]
MPFKDIIGHTREIEIIKGAILNKRVAHSYLFSGPEGIGKRKAALAFAAALNCQRPLEGEPCGTCLDCERMERGVHTNLLQVWPTDRDGERDDAGLIRVDQVREIQNAVKYRVESGTRVVVVDSAERFMAQAANAFLKTLEEPPAGSMIILISSRPSELLPTIISRCQRVNFRPLPIDALSGFLADKRGLPAGEAQSVARASGGSVSAAFSYLEAGANEKRKEVLMRLLSIEPGDTDEAIRLAEELSRRDDLEEVLEFIKGWYRDKAVYMEGAGGLVVNSDFAGHFDKDSGSRELWDVYSMVEGAKRSIMPPRYANKQLTLEALFLNISARA